MKSPRCFGAAVIAATLLTVTACTGGSSNGAFYSYHGAQAVGTFIPIAQRKPVHPFTGSLLSGGSGNYDLAKYRGQIVVVNFWGAWCGPCTVETPEFGLVYNAYKTKGVTFVGIDVKDGDRSEPRQFLAANHVTYPVIYDEDGRTAVTMGDLSTQAVPMTVLLDKAHRVAAVYITPLTPKDLDPALNKLIAEPDNS